MTAGAGIAVVPRLVEARYRATDPRILDKMAGLEAEADSRHGALDALHVKVDDLRQLLVRKKNLLKHDLANASERVSFAAPGRDPWSGAAGVGIGTAGGPPPPERQLEVDRLSEELARFAKLYQGAREHWQVAARVYEACRRFLDAADPAALVVVEVPYLHVADPKNDLALIRQRITELEIQVRAVEESSVDRDTALARLDAERVKAEARVRARRAGAARAFFAPKNLITLDALYGLSAGFGAQARELEAAIRDALDARFLDEIEDWKKAIKAHAVPGTPMPLDTRGPKLAGIATTRAGLERDEERIVVSAERDGLMLDRRDRAEPSVVLCTVFASEAA